MWRDGWRKIYTRLLLGLGLTSFSMHPQAIPEIKNTIMQTNAKILKNKVNAILNVTIKLKRLRLIETL